jgi:hypothetical protein
MADERSFSPADLARLRAEREVEIETSAAEGEPVHRTIIWVVVDRQDRVLIRSYRGPGARWFREATENPVARLHAGDGAIPVRVNLGADADRIESCSDGLLRKYAGDAATPRMVADEVLRTTLELTPA